MKCYTSRNATLKSRTPATKKVQVKLPAVSPLNIAFAPANVQVCAIHSTDTSIPAGKGKTCGVLLAGAFSGKNSK